MKANKPMPRIILLASLSRQNSREQYRIYLYSQCSSCHGVVGLCHAMEHGLETELVSRFFEAAVRTECLRNCCFGRNGQEGHWLLAFTIYDSTAWSCSEFVLSIPHAFSRWTFLWWDWTLGGISSVWIGVIITKLKTPEVGVGQTLTDLAVSDRNSCRKVWRRLGCKVVAGQFQTSWHLTISAEKERETITEKLDRTKGLRNRDFLYIRERGGVWTWDETNLLEYEKKQMLDRQNSRNRLTQWFHHRWRFIGCYGWQWAFSERGRCNVWHGMDNGIW
jgi:hypothetical protein